MRIIGGEDGRPRTVRAGRGSKVATMSSVAMIATMVVVSTLAAGTTVTAPFKGFVNNVNSEQAGGCHKVKLATPTWSMKTGTGGIGSIASQSKNCPASAKWIAGNSYVYADYANYIGLTLKVPSHTTQLNVSVTTTWTASDLIHNSSCPAPQPFAHSYNYSYPGYAYWDNVSGYSESCDVVASVYGNMYAFLHDLTNHSEMYASYSYGTGCTFGTCLFYGNYLENFNQTYVQTDRTVIDSNGNWSYSNTTFSNNYSSTAPTMSYSGSGVVPASFLFNISFVHGHAYALELTWFNSVQTSEQDWVGGYAAASANVQNSGNGIAVNSIAYT